MKKKTIISVAIVIIMLFLSRTIYGDDNLKKIIDACVLTQAKNSSAEEAKKICTEKFK